MASHDPYFTRAQLEARVSAKTVREVLDDNNDGTPDSDVIEQVRKDATSKVDSTLAAVGIVVDMNDVPYEVTRLSLDVAVAFLAQRHPEVMRKDWVALMAEAERELKALRDNETVLGPPPAPEAVLGGPEVFETSCSELLPR